MWNAKAASTCKLCKFLFGGMHFSFLFFWLYILQTWNAELQCSATLKLLWYAATARLFYASLRGVVQNSLKDALLGKKGIDAALLFIITRASLLVPGMKWSIFLIN